MLNQDMFFEPILLHVPCPIFWKDTKGNFLGCNKLFLKISGLNDYSELIGKTDAELPWKQYKESYAKDDQHVVSTGETITRSESIPVNDSIVISETTKSPLIKDGKIIGVVGICLDITDRKEAERLKIENEKYILDKLNTQEKFTELANQVVHDIRSPVASLLMIIKSCDEIPEKERVALREAANRVQDIANHLLVKHKIKESNPGFGQDNYRNSQEAMLVSTVLLELVTEKRFEYKNMLLKFETEFTQEGYFAFINSEPMAFKRMISNLINNAVDAIENNNFGKVLIKLNVKNNFVELVIQDNGKGMTKDVINKILSNIKVSEGKDHGYGIGLSQVRNTLQESQGILKIDSIPGQGTQIFLNFPLIKPPNWFAEEISIFSDDLVIILDDDFSIHSAWDTRFESIKQSNPHILIKHFENGEETLSFINNLSLEQKRKVLLLTDYELLHQNINGLDIIQKSGIERSILVTSHYSDQKIRVKALTCNAKILPKEMASEVMFQIIEDPPKEIEISHLKFIDLIILEDDPMLGKALKLCLRKYNVILYQNPEDFLNELDQYSKQTKISLDNSFATSDLDGIQLAEQIYKKGYKNLYMLSGEEFSPNELPDYITFIKKGDPEMIEKFNLRPIEKN